MWPDKEDLPPKSLQAAAKQYRRAQLSEQRKQMPFPDQAADKAGEGRLLDDRGVDAGKRKKRQLCEGLSVRVAPKSVQELF